MNYKAYLEKHPTHRLFGEWIEKTYIHEYANEETKKRLVKPK